jgi:probable F420-dependent oxidoreductase
VRIGVNVLNFGPDLDTAVLDEWAVVSEGLGYHLLAISDHVAPTADVVARYPVPFYEALTVLAYLAARTNRIELGTTVLVLPYRHPLHLAKVTSTLDQLSGGRLVVGVGVGGMPLEFDALGADFESRGAVSDDYLGAVLAAWADEVASHDGPFVRFDGVHTAPRPARRPHPPLWVGGNSTAAMQRAVRFGDAWHPIDISVEWLRDALDRLDGLATEAGRGRPALAPRLRVRITERPLDDDERLAGEGTIDQIHADLTGLRELGAEYVVLDTYLHDGVLSDGVLHEAASLDPTYSWRVYDRLAHEVLDLAGEGLR